MEEFYTVSRADISGKDELTLYKRKDISQDIFEVQDIYKQKDVKDLIDNFYPNGISNHGLQYLYNKFNFVQDFNNDYFVSYNGVMEGIFELIRLLKFSDCPSRFTSIFACKTFEDALKFKFENCNNTGDIYKVSSKKYFKADMNLLKIGSIPSSFLFAEKYWSGEGSKAPFWEYLLEDPVKIIEKLP